MEGSGFLRIIRIREAKKVTDPLPNLALTVMEKIRVRKIIFQSQALEPYNN
jgi:hypothetical protein